MSWTPQELMAAIRKAKLVRVLAVYLGISFAVIEAIDVVSDRVGLPLWLVPGAIVLLLIGLPIIVATALAQSAPTAPAAGSEPAREFDAFARVDREIEFERPTTAAEVAAVAKHWLTWRRAILGGVLAFALLGVATTGYMAMRVLGIGPVGSLVAAGVLDERERIILADFENHTDDPLLAGAVSEALRIDLAQSPIVTVVEASYVAGVLERMEREADAELDLELAREVAIRDGIKAVIAGAINAAGTRYVISARLLSAETGATFAGFRETAKDPDAIISAVDDLSKKLRERIGESLRTIRANEPLQAATTGSLDALRKYSQAERALLVEGDDDKGIALLEEAIALDTAFAMAWRKLGIALGNQGEQRAREVEALTKAYEHRDRLTERERYITIATYHNMVTGELDRTITAYRALLDIYPEETTALNNLAVVLWQGGDYEGAEEMARRALTVDSLAAFHYTNLIVALIGQGRIDEAAGVRQAMDRNLPGNPWGHVFGGMSVAYAQSDYEATEARLRGLLKDYGESRTWRGWANDGLAGLAAVRGRLADADGYQQEVLAAYRGRELPGEYLSSLVDFAEREARLLGERERGLALVGEALDTYPLDSLPGLDRPYLELARFYAIAGMPEQGRAMLAEYERIDPALRRAEQGELHAARGVVELATGDYAEAIRQLRLWEGAPRWCATCLLPYLAQAYELAGEADSAVTIYERYVTQPSAFRLYTDSFDLGPAYERLAMLYEQRGDARKAIYYYGKLAELWQDADRELRPRVEAARRAIAALSTDR